jgi:hypothetical protein
MPRKIDWNEDEKVEESHDREKIGCVSLKYKEETTIGSANNL